MTDNGWKSERQKQSETTRTQRNDMVERRIFVERGLLE